MRALISRVVLLAAIGAAVAVGADVGIQVGDEFSLPACTPGKIMQATPAIAFGRGTYLAVWREGWHGKGGSARIRAARVSTEGALLDGKGIDVAAAKTGVQERPRVAFGAGLFLVVWQDFRSQKDYDILATRISTEGKVIDADPIAVDAGPRTQTLADVASDGESFVVVWQGLRGNETAFRGFAATVSAAGKVGPPVETGMTPQPAIAWNGSDYLVASGGAGFWSGNVNATRLAADGNLRGTPVPIIRGTKAAIFSLSPVSGKGWLVVSHRSPPDPWGWGGPGAMRAVFVNREGAPENKDGVQEPSGVQDRLPGWLDIGKAKEKHATWPWGESASAFDGKRSLVVWQRHHLSGQLMTNFTNCDLMAARVEGFLPLDRAGIPVAATPAEERRPALASDGKGRLLLVYEKHEPDGAVIAAARILQTE